MRTIKVLVFSEYTPFSLSLISRLDKEGHKVFVITGSTVHKQRKPRAVFQEYHFTYDTDSLAHIVKNIHPDMAIIGTASDNLSQYAAGITNIMVALKDTTISQLLYLSSLSVFSGNMDSEIDEQTIAKPAGDQDKIILMGEEICLEFSKDRNYSVNILRFSEIYGSIKEDYLSDNICTNIFLQMIHTEEVKIQTNKRHHVLHLDDAVDGLYKVMISENEQNEIYHILGGEESTYSEREIMNLLENEISYETKVKVIENKEEVMNQKFITDKIRTLGFKEKYKLEDKINDLYYTIKKGEKRTLFIDSEKESILARIFKVNSQVKDKLLPYAENFLFFMLVNLFVFYTRSFNFHEVVDVYLLYVVVIALIYGFEQSIFTIILSVLARVYLTIYLDTSALSLSSEHLYLWILVIFTIGTLVGYLKEQYKLKYTEMTDEEMYLEGQLKEIKEINAVNLEVKELYESRLLNYGDSFGKIHEITAELDLVEPQGIIFRAIRVIQKIMNTEEVSIYLSSGNNRFFRLVASSANKERELKASLKASEYIRIFEKLERKEIYINKDLDPRCPMMASGIYKNGHLQSIVMVWSLPFESNNLYQMNILEITSRLIESKLNVAYEYMSNLGSSYQFKYDNMLDAHSFEKIRELYQLGQEEGIAEYTLIKTKKDPTMSREALLDRMKKNIRETDYMHEADSTIQILLTNTDEHRAQYVIDRLRDDGMAVKVGERIE